jgi:hypothetical protein
MTDDWRVRADFESRADKQRFLQWLEHTGLLEEFNVTPSGDVSSVFLYVPAEVAAERLVAALRNHFPTKRAPELELAIDCWLPDEQRWSGEPPPPPRVVSWVSKLLDALFGAL